MIYPFQCDECGQAVSVNCRPLHPPPAPICHGASMRRIYGCQINTSACRDASDIPANKRVVRSGVMLGKDVDSHREEMRFRRHIDSKRKQIKEDSNKGSPFRHTHSVPADLYHGKIRETGDKDYWQDPSNVSRHKDCAL
jgi:hypothetical protein